MGYFYVGAKTNQHKQASGKIGETNLKYLSTRIGQIRHKEGNFVVIKYLSIPNSTQAMTRAIEGDVRFMLEKDGYHNVQNDHFEWATCPATKMMEYKDFADKAITYAEQYCIMRGIEYTVHEGNPDARRTCRPRQNKKK